jgi:hypothetical protein
MTVFELELKRINWAALRASNGRHAGTVPDALRALAGATTEKEADDAYWRLDNFIVLQGAVFEAAEYVVQPLIQVLCGHATVVRRYALDLLIEITGAAAYVDPSEVERGNSKLVNRCRERAREGVGVVYWLLDSEDPWVRISAFELLEYIEPETERLLWVLRHIRDTDPDATVREKANQIVSDRGGA